MPGALQGTRSYRLVLLFTVPPNTRPVAEGAARTGNERSRREKMNTNDNSLRLGWREWVALPGMGLPAIKAKIDTGARTSALHAFSVEAFEEKGVAKVRFLIHPLQKRDDFHVECVAALKDYREVSDSGGHREMRYVIETEVVAGPRRWPIELTLTDRDTMRFRMLLGRSAMDDSMLIEPGSSYLLGRLDALTLYNLRKGVAR